MLEDRILGCLAGGALGDALGGPFEQGFFSEVSAANSTHPPTFVIPSELFISDDTQLTLATCEAIVDSGGVEPESIANRMTEWFRQRRITGMGSATLKALTELAAGGHWAFVGATGERSAGNGAAMRIAPLAFVLDPNDSCDRVTIRDVVRITHKHEEAYVGALAILLTIANLNARCLVKNLIETLPDSQVRDRFIEIRKNQWNARQYAKHYRPSGFVVDSVPLSVLSATECVDFMESVRFLIECGGDTDTTAAMFGNIIGAWKGAEFIPGEHAKKIAEFNQIQLLAAKLSELAI